MTRFEELGVGFQLRAETTAQACRSFEYSCNCCCNRGLRIDCSRCAIQDVHEKIVNMLSGTPMPRVWIQAQFC